MASKTYRGDRTIDGTQVTVDGAPLDPKTDVENYCDLGYEWTYVGDASRQLAFAILVDHFGDAAKARALTEGFTETVIANLNNEWAMTSDDVVAALTEIS